MTRLLKVLKLRARSLFQRRSVERELQRELLSHIDQQIDEHIAAGMSSADARHAALREFGGVSRFTDDVRDTWRVNAVDDVRRDLRYTWRGLRRRPLLVAVSVLSVGLGVCVNATIFALANTLFLSSPSAREADRLAHIQMGGGSHVSYPTWKALEATGALRGLAGYQIESEVNWTRDDAAVTLSPLVVTENFFDVLGVPVERGRGFTAREARAELDPQVAVISDAFWRSAFGADPGIVGRSITLNARLYTIVGVLAPHLRGIAGYGVAPPVYLPVSKSLVPDLDAKTGAAVQLVGRLHDGQSIDEGRAALATAAARPEVVATMEDSTGSRVTLFAQARGLSQGGAPGVVTAFLGVLFIIVTLIMAIACANVAGLLLARNTERRHEIALRLALGASRGRLVRQLLTEGLWLAFLGTVGGLLLAVPIMRLINGAPLPVPLPIELYLTIDPAVIAYALAMTAAVCVLTSLAPALDATRVEVAPTIKGEARIVLHRRFTLRRVLAIGQVAISILLLVTAALFMRNLARANIVNPGFDTEHTAVAQIAFVQDRFSRDARDAMLETALERVRALPGVTHAAISTGVPLTMRSGQTTGTNITVDASTNEINVYYHSTDVSPGYFETMGMRVDFGREFRATDTRSAPRVAVVNQEFVRRFFAGRDPTGHVLHLPGETDPVPTEIVGVVSNSKHRTLGESTMPAIYSPLLQREGNRSVVFLIARVTGQPGDVLAPMRRVISQLDATTAVETRTMRSAVAFAFLPSRIGAILVGSLGLLGMVLAMIGLFGMISFAASRRVREIAIRMSLGATRPNVIRLVLREAIAVSAVGMALGMIAATAVSGPISAFLVDGLDALDPWSYAGTSLVLAVVAMAAAWVPAWRASRIDPMTVLRRDQ